jgi:hypothetical protein
MSLVLPVPSSALTLSAQFGNRTKAGNASSSSDTTYSGTIYNAVYKLSGRTDLLATYATNQAAGTLQPDGLRGYFEPLLLISRWPGASWM